MTLPEFLGRPEAGEFGFFVEVPADYNKPLPEKYEMAELPPCAYLYFTGMPYEDPNDFPEAIGAVAEAARAYPFEKFGWKQCVKGPSMNLGAEPETGARWAVPVEKL